MRRRAAAVVVAGLLAVGALAGCGSGAGSSGDATITVFAASSLQEAFTTLGHRFERRHPGTKVVFSFGPSSGLAQQIQAGAPADVFASASPVDMRQVVTSGDVGRPATFTSNRMEVAVPPANPGHVQRLSDLARPGVKVAVCQAKVPCGEVAAKVFHNAGLTVHPATQEVDVKSVLSKVSLDEVDAGVVYVTDVEAARGKVKGVGIPAGVNATTAYPIATVKDSQHARLARQFRDLVLSPTGRTVLSSRGFGKP
ncbi:MAG: molybdate ABC transporter substrate-binding protein [Marmoricola sp.]